MPVRFRVSGGVRAAVLVAAVLSVAYRPALMVHSTYVDVGPMAEQPMLALATTGVLIALLVVLAALAWMFWASVGTVRERLTAAMLMATLWALPYVVAPLGFGCDDVGSRARPCSVLPVSYGQQAVLLAAVVSVVALAGWLYARPSYVAGNATMTKESSEEANENVEAGMTCLVCDDSATACLPTSRAEDRFGSVVPLCRVCSAALATGDAELLTRRLSEPGDDPTLMARLIATLSPERQND